MPSSNSPSRSALSAGSFFPPLFDEAPPAYSEYANVTIGPLSNTAADSPERDPTPVEIGTRQADPHPPLPPIKPALGFDPEYSPNIIGENVYDNRLVPFCDPSIDPPPGSLRRGPPPWSLSLESYYRIFHPYTRVFLGPKYAEQIAYYRDLKRWRLRRADERASQAELEGLKREASKAREVAWALFANLYGLHFLRMRFLAPYRDRAPGWSISRILNETLEFERSGVGPESVALSSGIQEYSVWPLPLPIPRTSNRHDSSTFGVAHQPSTFPTAPSSTSPPKSLIRLATLPEYQLGDYVTPTFDKNWHNTFSPLSVDALGEKYDREREREIKAGRVADGGVLARGGVEYDDEALAADPEYLRWERDALSTAAAGEDKPGERVLKALKGKPVAATEATKRFFGGGGGHLAL
ncbi:hypothetical protein JCM6882_005973 [Rhodosporidiobolus microsporus]